MSASMNFAHVQSLDTPDSIAYLERLKSALSELDAGPIPLFHLLFDLVWRDRNSLEITHLIVQIASSLRSSRRLLRGLNIVLPKGFQVEINADLHDQFDFFVLITPLVSRIMSVSGLRVPSPETNHELRKLLSEAQGINKLLEIEASPAWFSAISQLLQNELDDSLSDTESKRNACRCLHRLAKRGILPFSFFLTGATRDGDAISGGGFADIYTGKLGNKPICIKALRMYVNPPENALKVEKKFACEALVWRQVKHSNVLPFLGVSKSLVGSLFCLISPWMSNGNIMSYLSHHPNHDRFVSIYEVASGIDYLHHLDPSITHKDIKGANILVNDKGVCYLADFGLASVAQSQRLDSSTGGIAGSMCWLAPEFLGPDSTFDQDEKPRDIYAFACTIYEIFTGKPPFHDRGHGTMFAIIRGEWPALPPPGVWSTEEKNMWALVARARASNPTERMKIREIKNALRGARTSLEEYRSTVADEGRQLIVDNENFVNARAWLEKELSNPVMGDAVVDPFTPLIEEGVETPDFRDTRESSAFGSLTQLYLERRESQHLNDKGPPRGSPSTPSPLHLDLWDVRFPHGLATPISPSPSPLNPHAVPFTPSVAVPPLATAEPLPEQSENSSNAVTGEHSNHFFQMMTPPRPTLLRTPILTPGLPFKINSERRLPETQIQPRLAPFRLKPTSPAFVSSAGLNRNSLSIDIPSVTPPSKILQSRPPTPVSPPTTSRKYDVVFDCSALCPSLATYPPFGESAGNCEQSLCSNHVPISAAAGAEFLSQSLTTTFIDSNTRSVVRKLSVKAEAFFPMASKRSTAPSPPVMEVEVSPAGAALVMPSISQGVHRKLDASVPVFVPRAVLPSLKQASTLNQTQLFR